MKHLVGQTFSVGDGQYRVVDVRQLTGELMVSAEALDEPQATPTARRPRRAAFHYGDIAAELTKPAGGAVG